MVVAFVCFSFSANVLSNNALLMSVRYPLRDRGSLQLAANSSQSLSTKSLLLPNAGDILHDLQYKRKEFLVRSMSGKFISAILSILLMILPKQL